MRYGIMSDIHSNLEAFNACLERIGQVDAYVSPGDIVGYGASPNECCEIISRLAPTTVVGNHDAAVLGNLDLSWFNPSARAAAVCTSQILSDTARLYLSQLQLDLSKSEWSLVHGSLDDPGSFKYITSPWTAKPTFEAMPVGITVCFIGHTHIAEYYAKQSGIEGVDRISMRNGGKIALRDGFSYIINCGSIGQPRDGNPLAGCGIYDSASGIIEFFRVPYDIAETQRKIRDAGLPASLADRLALGI
ncbi:MAG: metallophosphoesterase family protein [Armatimonadota bacterium]|nr:metallophosphoesterase family protein [Armatimonadota bacterium]